MKIVKRILKHRESKSRDDIIKEAKVYEKYRENLRKIKGRQNSLDKLRIVR